LFKKYRSAADFAKAPVPQLEEDLKRIGLFRNKAKAVQKACQILVEKYGGEVPNSMVALRELPGVGRKTANVVLGNAFNINEGVVVDTHVARLSQRLGFTREEKPEKIELELMRVVPREQWAIFSHWIIWHGRRRCYARNPDCPTCELAKICPSFQAAKS
jgi:endonuclease-3